ncbi:MAG: hypothetical protein D6689_10615 [Deltaproteobacteria bacterium]|nr:MAG: hypothetical protein D6689_10615 [Deltaproteobacteria bacterium]
MAVATVLWWGLGIELAPGLHVALHEMWEHHHHDGDDDRDGDHGAPDPRHGRHSLAHKHVAMHQAPPPPPVLPATVVAELKYRDRDREAPPSRCPTRARARGPPRDALPMTSS